MQVELHHVRGLYFNLGLFQGAALSGSMPSQPIMLVNVLVVGLRVGVGLMGMPRPCGPSNAVNPCTNVPPGLRLALAPPPLLLSAQGRVI